MSSEQVREVITYGEYFADFYRKLDKKTRLKVDWTINLLETFEIVPTKYFKYLTGTDRLYEIRVEYNSNIYRIFCFFDHGKLIVATNGFQKKTQKIPRNEIDRALRIKKQYFDEKNKIKTFQQHLDEQYGKSGTPKRDEFEAGYEAFKLGVLLREMRHKQGITQEELAKNVEQQKAIFQELRTIPQI